MVYKEELFKCNNHLELAYLTHFKHWFVLMTNRVKGVILSNYIAKYKKGNNVS